jgi:acyl-CoA thioesterase-1
MVAILKKIRASGAQPYLAGMDLPTNLGADYRERFKAVFKRVAQSQQVPTLNFLLEGVGGRPELNQADGMHPTEAGQVKVAATVAAFLKPKLKALPIRQRSEASGGSKVLRRRQALSTGGKP